MPGASSAAERCSSLVFVPATGNVQNTAFLFVASLTVPCVGCTASPSWFRIPSRNLSLAFGQQIKGACNVHDVFDMPWLLASGWRRKRCVPLKPVAGCSDNISSAFLDSRRFLFARKNELRTPQMAVVVLWRRDDISDLDCCKLDLDV